MAYQNKCPHMLMTASFAVARQILQSKLPSCDSLFCSSSFDGGFGRVSSVLTLSDDIVASTCAYGEF